MGTKIIVDGRHTGKTTKAILESAKTGYPILAFDRRMANCIVSQADDMGVKIPTPLTIQQARNGKLDGHKRGDRLIVDEGIIILERMIGMSIHMITISEIEEVNPIMDVKKRPCKPEFLNGDEWRNIREEALWQSFRFIVKNMNDEEFEGIEEIVSRTRRRLRDNQDSFDAARYAIQKLAEKESGELTPSSVPRFIHENLSRWVP